MQTPFRIACVGLLLLSASALRSAEKEDRWYAVRFQGHHAGWMHERVEESEDRLSSETAMHLSIKRGAFSITIEMGGSFVETADGRPVSCVARQKMAMEEMEKRVTFGPDGIDVLTLQGGRQQRQRLPAIAKPWLTPGAVGRLMEQKLAAGEKSVTYTTIDPGISLEPFDVTVELRGEKEIEVYGRRVKALEWGMTMSNLPGAKMTEFTDAKGQILRSTMDFGGMQVEVLAADKELAMADLDPPELVASTLVKPSFALRHPRERRAAAYRLSVEEGRMPDLPESTFQQVRRVDEGTVDVTVDLNMKRGTGSRDLAGSTPATQEKVRNNTMIAGDDPKIIALMKQATADVDGGPERAEALRRFVSSYIQRADLSVGMASASEVAQTRTGDCTEHAVLLAAMLQADGIPARTASGLIYVERFVGREQVFGYHMWTQAWLGGRWVDLDATITNPFDAAHILLGTSHLDGEEGANTMVTMGPLTGKLRIDIAADERR